MKPNHGKSVVKYRNFQIRIIVPGLLLLTSLIAEAAVKAELDRHRIVEGETVTLTILTDNSRQNLEADFSLIEKDFEILDRRSETQLSIVNGRQTAVVRLLLTLEPRHAGEFEIAPLVFGKETTRPIRVQVDPAPEPEPGAQPPVFIEVEIEPAGGPYFVHAQLGLVVRVFYQQNLTEAAISQPEPSPASVRLMQETPYQAERGGERYRVLERNYAVFPERSGELLIPPMQLTGRLVEKRNSSVWQPTVRGRRVQVQSDPLRLSIDPRPTAFTGTEWQPARDFQLTQQISSGDSLRVGEPVTRTVIVDAIGLEENMIVEPVWPELKGARIYPDQPQGITRDDGSWVLGHKEFRYAVVPETEGELVLPELRVEWWDTMNNRQRTAVLDSHTIFVEPSALVLPPPQWSAQAESAADGLPSSYPSPDRGEPGYWRWLAILFAALWLITLAAAWYLAGRRQVREAPANDRKPMPEQEAVLISNLRQACKKGDVRQARRVLSHWLRTFGTENRNGSLLEFAAGTDNEALQASVYVLDSQGFRVEPGESWNGDLFWQQFEAWRKNQRTKARAANSSLTDLYAKENRPTAPS